MLMPFDCSKLKTEVYVKREPWMVELLVLDEWVPLDGEFDSLESPIGAAA